MICLGKFGLNACFAEGRGAALSLNGSLFRAPGPYRDLFGILGPYLYFRVPIFSVLTIFTWRMSIQSAMQSLHEYNNELTWSVCDE